MRAVHSPIYYDHSPAQQVAAEAPLSESIRRLGVPRRIGAQNVQIRNGARLDQTRAPSRPDRRLGARLSRAPRTVGNPGHGHPRQRRDRIFMHRQHSRELTLLPLWARSVLGADEPTGAAADAAQASVGAL